jgi:hypothetical protein
LLDVINPWKKGNKELSIFTKARLFLLRMGFREIILHANHSPLFFNTRNEISFPPIIDVGICLDTILNFLSSTQKLARGEDCSSFIRTTLTLSLVGVGSQTVPNKI